MFSRWLESKIRSIKMVSGYNNFPEEMFYADGTIIMGHVIPGLYDKFTKVFSNNKPFFVSCKMPPTGVQVTCCPIVMYDHVLKRYMFFIFNEAVALGQDNIIVPFDN